MRYECVFASTHLSSLDAGESTSKDDTIEENISAATAAHQVFHLLPSPFSAASRG